MANKGCRATGWLDGMANKGCRAIGWLDGMANKMKEGTGKE
jgi:hypothetical protein